MLSHNKNLNTGLPYNSSQQCQSRLAGTEAIDYFFAARLTAILKQAQLADVASDSEVSVDMGSTFHIFLALSYFQRKGHSCLDLTAIAGTQLWMRDDAELTDEISGESSNGAQGYVFAEFPQLLSHLQQAIALDSTLNAYVVFESDTMKLFSSRLWHYENTIASLINERLTNSRQRDETLIDSFPAELSSLWSHLFPKSAILYDVERIIKLSHTDMLSTDVNWQEIAVLNSLLSSLSIISGGAGTGKTYTSTRALLALSQWRLVQTGNKPRILLAAPTGKAAQRLQESIDRELRQLFESVPKDESLHVMLDSLNTQNKVSTIHRLLGLSFNNTAPKFHSEKTLPCDILLIDEASMIDIPMMAKLLSATPSSASIILLGDANQLPSVESGSVLRDLVSSTGDEQKHVTFLQTGRRSNSQISGLANAVLTNKTDDIVEHLKMTKANQYNKPFKNEYSLSDEVYQQMASAYTSVFSSSSIGEALKVLDNYRCLTPTNSGPFGTVVLNREIEKALAKTCQNIKIDKLYQGLPIMVTQNDYKLKIFNGDVGIIWPDQSGQLKAWFVSEQSSDSALVKERAINIHALPAFERVYAMTIHKTQGSEFSSIDIVLPKNVSENLSRELLYTAITRAKDKVSIIGDVNSVLKISARSEQRASGLIDKLQKHRVDKALSVTLN